MNSPDKPGKKKSTGKKTLRKLSRAAIPRRRARLWKADPFCRSCRKPVVDLRLLKKSGVTILTEKVDRVVAWIDKDGRRREELIATVHHIQSLKYHRLHGKKKPHRASNLVLLCRDCHEKIELAFGSGTSNQPPNKPR